MRRPTERRLRPIQRLGISTFKRSRIERCHLGRASYCCYDSYSAKQDPYTSCRGRKHLLFVNLFVIVQLPRYDHCWYLTDMKSRYHEYYTIISFTKTYIIYNVHYSHLILKVIATFMYHFTVLDLKTEIQGMLS